VSFPRRLEPEWLDQMPADDPRAIRVRRDLRRVNVLMQNARCMASALRRHGIGRQPAAIADLGSGDGKFMLRVARQLAPHWPQVRVILQDRQDIVSDATLKGFAALGWSVETACADVFDFLGAAQASVDVVTSNLFLHHFDDAQLGRLLERAAQSARLVVACEPRRSKFVVRASRLLRVVGCSEASVHDAVVSARAGFTGRELSALWPTQEHWQLHERSAAIFTHSFIARRSGSAIASAAKDS
jgi:Methyltransferase domain